MWKMFSYLRFAKHFGWKTPQVSLKQFQVIQTVLFFFNSCFCARIFSVQLGAKQVNGNPDTVHAHVLLLSVWVSSGSPASPPPPKNMQVTGLAMLNCPLGVNWCVNEYMSALTWNELASNPKCISPNLTPLTPGPGLNSYRKQIKEEKPNSFDWLGDLVKRLS